MLGRLEITIARTKNVIEDAEYGFFSTKQLHTMYFSRIRRIGKTPAVVVAYVESIRENTGLIRYVILNVSRYCSLGFDSRHPHTL